MRWKEVTLALLLGLAAIPAVASTGEQEESLVVVFPEHTTKVPLSSTDVNRFVCPGPIKDVVFSQDKGIRIKIAGENAFVKFQALKKGQEVIYTKTPSEFFVICDGDVYSMIGLPKKIPSQTIRLTSGRKKRIEKNLSIFAGLPLEKKILKLIRQAYTGDLPESYSVRPVWKQLNVFDQLWLTAKRDIEVEGEGLGLREYIVSLKAGQGQWRLNEADFLNPQLTHSPLAVAIEEPLLDPGDITRVFIVERRNPDARRNPLVRRGRPEVAGPPAGGDETASVFGEDGSDEP
ncbi:conjugal transfer pilus assembly protein TraK [Geothermobacter ehrlichii]|uniref:Conjugal transfer pilus assembly protein TraK n=1 Tax=Geothermobacter ehrlichii TaxID=213224 RepID=A0A5D3WHJ2_9BACT|nr:type-F conjugative transfer system secretin TraK [Geothermobacter ehrlichii]TYO96792.1 conjugal transfer pilus assembly protein TraK [Geothermobacter ehrlichii]